MSRRAWLLKPIVGKRGAAVEWRAMSSRLLERASTLFSTISLGARDNDELENNLPKCRLATCTQSPTLNTMPTRQHRTSSTPQCFAAGV
eukprot:5463638-Amphidinium_carterae.1